MPGMGWCIRGAIDGLDRLVFGWQINSGGKGQGSYAEITRRAGRVEVFSSDGDLTTLEADLSLSAGSLEPRQVNVALNGGVLASLGFAELCVRRRPRVAFFSTGDELRSIGETLAAGEIVCSDAASLAEAGGRREALRVQASLRLDLPIAHRASPQLEHGIAPEQQRAAQ